MKQGKLFLLIVRAAVEFLFFGFCYNAERSPGLHKGMRKIGHCAAYRCMLNTPDGPTDVVEDYLCDPEEIPAGTRESRLPCPDQCVLSEWSSWTTCPLVRKETQPPFLHKFWKQYLSEVSKIILTIIVWS